MPSFSSPRKLKAVTTATFINVEGNDYQSPRKKIKRCDSIQSIESQCESGIAFFTSGEFYQAQSYFAKALCRLDVRYLCNVVQSDVATTITIAKGSFLAERKHSDRSGNKKCEENTGKLPIAFEYDEGMRVYNDPIPLNTNKTYSIHTPDMMAATLCYNIGQTYIQRGKHEIAREWYSRALERCNTLSHLPTTSIATLLLVRILSGLGYCRYRMGGKSQAIAMNFYQDALSLVVTAAERQSPLLMGNIHLAAALNCIAVLKFNRRDQSNVVMETFHKSLELYEVEHKTLQQKQIMQKENNKEDVTKATPAFATLSSQDLVIRMATVWNNIGRMHYLRMEYPLALVAYQRALTLRRENNGENKFTRDSMDTAAILYNTAQAHQQMRQSKEALACYHEFLSIATCRCDSNGVPSAARDVCFAYKGIAEIYQDLLCDFQSARHYWVLVLNHQIESLGGRHHPEVAMTLNKLGNVCFEMKDHSSALKYYHDGLAVEEALNTKRQKSQEKHTLDGQLMNSNTLDCSHDAAMMITLTNIGHVYKHLCDYRNALIHYERVLKILKQMETGDEVSAQTTGNEGNSQASVKGGCMVRMVDTLSSIGLMQYHLCEYESSFETYQLTLELCRREKKDGTDEHLDIASTLNSIGLVLFKQERMDWAQECFVKSLSIRIKLLGRDHRDVAILWYNIATIYLERGEHEEAIAMYKETLRVERAALGKGHADVVLTLQHLGQVLQQWGNMEEAIECFQEALKIQEEVQGAKEKTKENGSEQGFQGSEKSRQIHGRLLNLLGNAYLQLGDIGGMMKCFVDACRLYQTSSSSGNNKTRDEGTQQQAQFQQTDDILIIAGFTFYGLSKTNPPCAAMA